MPEQPFFQDYPAIVILRDSRCSSEDLSGRVGYFIGFRRFPDTQTPVDFYAEDAHVLFYIDPDYVFSDPNLHWSRLDYAVQADPSLLQEKYSFDKRSFLASIDSDFIGNAVARWKFWDEQFK